MTWHMRRTADSLARAGWTTEQVAAEMRRLGAAMRAGADAASADPLT